MSFIITLTLMVIVFGLIYWFKYTGGEKVVTIEHDYFSRLWLWPKGEHTRWEAEYDLQSAYSDGTVGLHAEDNYEIIESPEPTIEEINFAMEYLLNLEQLFLIALEGVKEGWSKWFHEELPHNWEGEFIIDGFTVPANGDTKNTWGITLFCYKAGHYFCLSVENGKPKLESIDG